MFLPGNYLMLNDCLLYLRGAYTLFSCAWLVLQDDSPNTPTITGVLVYIGSPNRMKNQYYLGPAPLQDMARWHFLSNFETYMTQGLAIESLFKKLQYLLFMIYCVKFLGPHEKVKTILYRCTEFRLSVFLPSFVGYGSQIAKARGPAGPNYEYLFRLEEALNDIGKSLTIIFSS